MKKIIENIIKSPHNCLCGLIQDSKHLTKSLVQSFQSPRAFYFFSVLHKGFTGFTVSQHHPMRASVIGFIHTLTSLLKCYLGFRNNLNLYIYYLMGFDFGLSTHAKRLLSWLNGLEKTCQAHFLRVEANVKKWRGCFAQQLVIFEGSDLTISNYSFSPHPTRKEKKKP